jgi:SAM-dependent methyltransferase
LQISDGHIVLDAGCGEGRHTFEACKRAECSVYAMDIDHESLRKVRYMLCRMLEQRELTGWGEIMEGSAMELPFADGTFDRIICSEVLEHIPDENVGMRELTRVLKPGGRMAVSVPTFFTEAIYGKLSYLYFHNPGGHVRKFHYTELIADLRACGLQVYAIRYKHALHSIYWLLRCAFGLENEQSPIPALYHAFLVRAINSRFVDTFESACDYFFPKSVVVYTRKPNGVGPEPRYGTRPAFPSGVR